MVDHRCTAISEILKLFKVNKTLIKCHALSSYQADWNREGDTFWLNNSFRRLGS